MGDFLDENLCFDFCKNLFNHFTIIPRNGASLRNLHGFSAFSGNNERVSWTKHNECRTNRIIARRDNPEIFSFLALDAFRNLSNDRKRIFCICVVISEKYYISQLIGNHSHFWTLGLITVAGCSKN